MKSEKLNQIYSNEVALSDNETDNFAQNEVFKEAKKAINEKQDGYLKEVSMEILKKADLKGSTEKIASEFVRIYNMLNTLLGPSNTTRIPKQTVFKDYIICLEDGKKMQMLKRHLKVKYHMSFQDYKQKWNLPIDYPDTAESYSQLRSKIAKKRRKRKKTDNGMVD